MTGRNGAGRGGRKKADTRSLVDLLNSTCSAVAELAVPRLVELVLHLACVFYALIELQISVLVGLGRGFLLVLEAFRQVQVLRWTVRDTAFFGEGKTLFLACLACATEDAGDDLDAAETGSC